MYEKKIIDTEIPIKTVSESNLSGEHWTKKMRRHRDQKSTVHLYLKRELMSALNDYDEKLKICLTRIAPRKLDEHDNLKMSLKWIVDAICEIINPGLKTGYADSNENLEFEYYQEKRKVKEYSVKIEIFV